ncbi:protein white [Daktulosphaira vitifoliae]|uniref:protein white n=1 Tax=Daktulosphaira vitifoliae TaxID=58002 RepID=UPI0021A9B037|nr:protein white [Daktulosphaira vitifoliae]
MGNREEKKPLLVGNKNGEPSSKPYYLSLEESKTSGLENHQKITYTWTNMNVHTKNGKSPNVYQSITSLCSMGSGQKKQKKKILKNVSGSAHPGELLALMGSSGAGKTTLLNSLTFRSDRNVVETGVRAINGVPINSKTLTAVSAYVQQHDLFIGTLTVREHLTFQALVRMDRHIPHHKRMARVEEVIQELSLKKCEDTIIGVPGKLKGLSGGEMKRLSFASEVLTDPPLMFCDEPTSGLDSFMAQNVISVLKSMSTKGKTIICTIHQPSSEVYSMFDKILLLANGQTAFLGTPNEAIDFFKTLGVTCPKNHNPADFFIQLLAIVPTQEVASHETIETVCEAYENSIYKQNIMAHQRNLMDMKKNSIEWDHKELSNRSPYKATWLEQFSAVFWRSWLSVKKEPTITKVRMVQTIMVACLISFIFYNQRLDQDGVMNINGALFMCISNMTFQNVLAVINVFCSELPVFMREHYNGMYRTDVYFLCKTFAEIPIFLVIPVLFTVIIYYLIGLNPKLIHFFISIIIITLVSLVAVSFGYLISCVSGNISVALSIGPTIVIPFLLFGGYFLNVNSIPSYFRWLSFFSWFKYANEGLLINQWADINRIECNRVNTTCPRTGHAVLESVNFLEGNFYMDIVLLFCLIIIFRILAFLALLARTSRK